MLTLDKWRTFAAAGGRISFPEMELIGADHEPPIVVGSGEIQMDGLDGFAFRLEGRPKDFGYALAASNRAREQPYEPLARLRLFGTDADGVKWCGGWTNPKVDPGNSNWTFAGDLEALVTDVEGDSVSPDAGTELLFPLRIGDPMTVSMARFVRTWAPIPVREYRMEALGSEIRFAYQSDHSAMLVTASNSAELRIPYADTWLAEPLRILFGQLSYPRLVARNFGNRRASVWVRPSPPVLESAYWTALIAQEKAIKDDEEFWSLYRGLLELVALARDEEGNPTFEPNTLTRLYEEIILASRGSRWIWALSYASSIEAVLRMITPKDTAANETEQEAVEAVAKHIKKYDPGNSSQRRLRDIALGAVKRTATISAVQALRELRDSGVITKAQFSAWDDLRNSVAHGSLLSPYSNEVEDQQLLELSSLMRALTRELVKRHTTKRSR